MSGHQYLGNSGNLFGDDGDVDDETFLRNSRPKISHDAGYSGVKHPSRPDGELRALEEQRQAMVQRKLEVEQRTLDSSARSLGILRDSEQIGIATAEELMRQREQLERSSRRLDEINANLRFSQKHINGIKSVFSSLRNYISGKSDAPATPTPASEVPRGGAPLAESMERAAHGAEAARAGLEGPGVRAVPWAGCAEEPGGSRRMNQLLEANLDEMAGSISRLKGLATGLGEEIESQNDLLDTMGDKVETADLTINRQNKQMNKLLGK